MNEARRLKQLQNKQNQIVTAMNWLMENASGSELSEVLSVAHLQPAGTTTAVEPVETTSVVNTEPSDTSRTTLVKPISVARRPTEYSSPTGMSLKEVQTTFQKLCRGKITESSFYSLTGIKADTYREKLRRSK